MHSSENSIETSAVEVDVLYKHSLSSEEDPPREEWSSLNISEEVNYKMLLASEGLYDVGSGEICTKYIAQSDSSVLRHVYFNYPSIPNPGIKKALFNEIPTIIFPDDGQELYLEVCKEMGQCPVNMFHVNLLEEAIDLKYYGVHWKGIRPMAMALRLNRHVKVLNLTDNWLSKDACFHLGEMLSDNGTLAELNLTGCRIGTDGARILFSFLPLNSTLRNLNVSKNKLGDDGAEFLADAIFKGSHVTNLNLSHNNLTEQTLTKLNIAFETHNKLTHLNLSWNMIRSPNAIFAICQHLSENKNFQELDLSWNSCTGARVGLALKTLLLGNSIQKLNVRNNMLQSDAVGPISAGMLKSKNLTHLDISNNPLSPTDAMKLLLCLKGKKVLIKELLLDNIMVTDDFVDEMNAILKLKFRKETVVVHGYIRTKFTATDPDFRDIVMSRANYLGKRKTKSIEIGLIALELFQEMNDMDSEMFGRFCTKKGLKIDGDLLDGLIQAFPGPRTGKGRSLNLKQMVDYVKRKWPDMQLPPTPPPEIIPVEVPKQKSKGKKK